MLELARGEYFKWASDDDRYRPTLLASCIAELDRHPEIVLCHAWEAFIGEDSSTILPVIYRLATADPKASVRLRSLLYVSGGDDIYGVIRTAVLRQNSMHGSYHHADRTFVAALALHGPFHQVPEVLYLRRDHPGRTERSANGRRSRAAILDPRRGNRWRNPMVRLYGEYIWGYVAAILHAPLSFGERARCLSEVAWWALGRLRPGGDRRVLESTFDPAVQARALRSIDERKQRFSRTKEPSRSRDAS